MLEDRIVDLTSDQFLRMAEDLFYRDRRYYLWDGRVVEKAGKTVAFFVTSVRLHEVIRPYLTDDWLAWPHNPLRLDDRHAPLPELAIIRGPIDIYERENRFPNSGDVGLVVEIVYSSLAESLGPRAEVFARTMVPAYWAVDVIARRIVEHRGPSTVAGVGTYGHVRPLLKGDEIPLILDDVLVGLIPVSELLP